MHIAAASRAVGDYGNAISLYRHATTMDASDPESLVALGDTLLEMGKSDDAIINYNAVLKLSPKSPEALRGLAEAHLKTGRLDWPVQGRGPP
jgi:Flp pilus assembly protein TadD